MTTTGVGLHSSTLSKRYVVQSSLHWHIECSARRDIYMTSDLGICAMCINVCIQYVMTGSVVVPSTGGEINGGDTT